MASREQKPDASRFRFQEMEDHEEEEVPGDWPPARPRTGGLLASVS
jgi:hypothetical protein